VPDGDATSFFVFDADGAFLGRVRADRELGGFRIRGNHLVAAGHTPLGEPVVRLYRIG
jgi:hypothetical protein